MADFKVVGSSEQLRTVRAAIESATVIEAGDLVTMTSGYIVKAGATDPKLAFCPKGSAAGETVCEVTVGNDFLLEGTADANFAITDKGAEVDVKIDTAVQLIDLGESAIDALIVDISEEAGTAGSALGVRVKIATPIF